MVRPTVLAALALLSTAAHANYQAGRFLPVTAASQGAAVLQGGRRVGSITVGNAPRGEVMNGARARVVIGSQRSLILRPDGTVWQQSSSSGAQTSLRPVGTLPRGADPAQMLRFVQPY